MPLLSFINRTFVSFTRKGAKRLRCLPPRFPRPCVASFYPHTLRFSLNIISWFLMRPSPCACISAHIHELSVRLGNTYQEGSCRRRRAGMWKEPLHDRAQQKQTLAQPVSVRTSSCCYTQMCHTGTPTHSPHIYFISSCIPPLSKQESKVWASNS